MEEAKMFQDPQNSAPAENGKKPLDVAALVLGIIAVVGSFIPLISYICGITGLVFAIKHRNEKRTTAALVLCIIGLILGVIFHVANTLVLFNASVG